MLSLYEASYLGKEGEVVLIEAMDFTTKHLKNLMEEGSLEPRFGEHVAYALELPLNWRMERIHARWWTDLGLAQRLPFFRDRLMENYFWTVGWAFEPQFWSFREMQPKLVSLITVIDNVYDVYGPLDELEHFTNVVDSGQMFANQTCWKRGGTIMDVHPSLAELARGDVPKSIQCYKHEKSVSEDVAREKVREAISVNWRALNEYRTSSSPLEEHFKRVTINIPRLAQFLYKCGDGYDIPDGETKNQVMLLFIQPIEF
ncbi:Myrcene synthase, chloroplastic [Musa troglodytarum]|uniref:Myrcene synthase, chloroplastic n=1 Tax=Musa troglodytarum TaxID=320322 RepID=A0A9E7GQN4_9LILI|nr:Myrcene synthase, chloroplastic [Musa troglodytarum]